MKLKQLPEDFQVEELPNRLEDSAGEFALYRLEKTGWTTPDALAAIRRRWQVDIRRLSYGGLKDRHAVTSQYLTIFRGPQRNLNHERITVTYLGQRREPFTAADIAANRFSLVLRSLTSDDVKLAILSLDEVSQMGVPNYFDDQRFGSVGNPPEFVAKEMVLGRFERALWIALAAPYEHDRAEAKREKQTLRTHWGDWPPCKEKLPRGHARSLVDYLVSHPQDFKGAATRLRPDLLGLYLSAYQSYLWNRLLAEWLEQEVGREHLGTIALKLGPVPAPRRIGANRPATAGSSSAHSDHQQAAGDSQRQSTRQDPPSSLADEQMAKWRALQLPLPSARLKPEPGVYWLPLLEKVLLGEGLTLANLKIRGLTKPFFSRGDRAACLSPNLLSVDQKPDELNRGKHKLLLCFELPRGCYATMVVKRIMDCAIPDQKFA